MLLAGALLFASLPRRTCYQGDFQDYFVQVDQVTRFGKTTSFVVARSLSGEAPTIIGSYTGEECEFLTLSSPFQFVGEPATSADPSIKKALNLLENSRVAVATDEHIVRPVKTPLWVKLVPLRLFL